MKFTRILTGVSLGLLTVLISSQPVQAAEPYPLEYWALRAVVQNVNVSPNGKYMALMKISTRDANPLIEVYTTDRLDKKPFVFGADKMEITNFYWVGDHDMIVAFRQKVRDKIEGFNQGVYENKIALLDIEDEEYTEFKREVNPTVDNTLPGKPNKVILSFNPEAGGDRESPGELLPARFRPRAYYEFDIERQTKKLILQGKISMGQISFTADGEPQFGFGFDRGSDELTWFYRKPGAKDWIEMYRLHEDNFEQLGFDVHGVDPDKPDHILVSAHNGEDKVSLWSFDVNNKRFAEKIYGRSDVNVAGVRYHSNPWTDQDTIVGVAYQTDKTHIEYLDPVEGATYAQLDTVIPNAHDVRITSRSRDGNTMVIRNIGPRDPGTYYLLKDGKLQTVGSRQPLLKSEDLADVKYIHYEARDGRQLHGYITVPNSEPPFPLIVLPHGGPFVSETISYDEWGQMLANNGYLVLQPQYRGSTNYGLDYYLSAFREGGQGGYKMQDDKDDGAMYLVKEGMADPDRIAMFGWSYGGYAALVAASRTPQIHQCVIAGAAVSDPMMQVNYYEQRMRGAQRVEQMNMWTDSISPVDEAGKVNVPLLLIHGSVDQRVPPAHQRVYRNALEKHNKDYKFVELDGADHFSSTLFFNHQHLLYTSIIDFLKKDCGPGGL